MPRVEEIISDRARTHGDWPTQAQLLADLIGLVARSGAGERMSATQVVAMNMAMLKVARICCGDPNHADHWRDIAGYATLVADELDAQQQGRNNPPVRD